MIKANQSQVVHTTNVGLVNLRQAEIDYFASFYGTFGKNSFYFKNQSLVVISSQKC